MIPIDRGQEPDELCQERKKRLPEARKLWQKHDGPSLELKSSLKGYQCTRDRLFQRQHKKCAYCERKPGLDGQPVEHFRPKKEALRNLLGEPKKVDKDRYWWLTWHWENLLFVCHTCNSGKKRNYFPLTPGTDPLPIESTDLAIESALLLDPADTNFDPQEHLRWRPTDRTLHPARWTWGLEGLTDRGKVTCQILDLESRADEVTMHFRKVIWPAFKGITESTNPRDAQGSWGRLQRDYLKPKADLVAATWWMLEELRKLHPELNFRSPQIQ